MSLREASPHQALVTWYVFEAFWSLAVPGRVRATCRRVTGFAVWPMGQKVRREQEGAREEVTAVQVATPAMTNPWGQPANTCP